MKFYVVSDDADACVGMRLAGVESVLVHDKADAAAALEKAADNVEIGILFVTGGIRRLCAEKVAALSAGNRPVVVEIPAGTEIGKTGGTAADYIREAVGINL